MLFICAYLTGHHCVLGALNLLAGAGVAAEAAGVLAIGAGVGVEVWVLLLLLLLCVVRHRVVAWWREWVGVGGEVGCGERCWTSVGGMSDGYGGSWVR